MVKTIGKASIQPLGQWVQTNPYVRLQVVSNLGSSYIAIQDVPANTSISDTDYWMLIASKGDKGNTGKGISSITKTGTSGLVDTYTITYSDASTSTFTVTNGNGITNISVTKTGTSGLVDTYTMTITMAAGSPVTTTFTITNGEDGEVQDVAIAPAYDSSVAYKAGILCSYQGKLYYCKQNAPAGTLPTNTTYFREASVAGDFVSIIKITDQATTLGDINTILNGTGGINPKGLHVLFDVGALGASMYLCTIYLNADTGVYKIFDLVLGRVAEGTYSSTKLLTMAIANADTLATQEQIDDLQEQINELGGKSLIKDWDTLGEQIKAGTSTNYVRIGDTIDVNWNKTVLGTTTPSSLTVTCSDRQAFVTEMGEAEAKDYLFVYDGSNWTYNEETVNLADYGVSVSGTPVTGEVMTITTTVTTISYTFTSYDTATPTNSSLAHNWLLEQTYAPDTKAYDAIEACMVLVQGKTLAAGNYYWTAHLQGSDSAQTRYFTIAADITATNGDIQFAPTATNWTSPYVPTSMTPYYKGSTSALGSAIALSATEISGATDVSSVDGVSVHDSTYQMAFGNNCWDYSNIRQWLNSDAASNGYVPTHDYDRPSGYNNGAGFLYAIDPRVLALIQPCDVKCTAGYNNGSHTQGQTYTVSDKVFLLSMKEMSFNINTGEGDMTQLYGSYTNNTLTNDAVASRAKYNKAGGTINSYRWSRSAYTYGASYARYVFSSGAYDGSYALNALYVAPAFIIGKI